jgi:carbon monoxide dehydrogenase subunit G
MAEYSFATIWRLDAPVDAVFDTIDDSLAWPEWWPSVRSVEEVEPERPDGLGALRRYTFKGRLPYALRFDSRVTARERPTAISGTATGELEGTGDWRLTENDGTTVVRYDWNIRTTRPWMNALAPLPFVDPIFRLNHHAVMRDGLHGISRRLGVRGSYERLR